MANFDMCDPCNAEKKQSLCDGDCSNNIWFVSGRCKLDNLTYDQVYFVLQRNPNAKNDLLRVTTDPNLIDLANHSSLIQDPIEMDLSPYRVINNPKNTLPFYTLFKGNMNGNFK